MWAVPKLVDDKLELDSFEPEQILDFYDSPLLFTLRDRHGRLLLAYRCDANGSTERFLVVPTSARQIAELQGHRISLRDALLNQGWTWLVDLEGSGHIENLGLIDPTTLPEDSLPRPEAYL